MLVNEPVINVAAVVRKHVRHVTVELGLLAQNVRVQEKYTPMVRLTSVADVGAQATTSAQPVVVKVPFCVHAVSGAVLFTRMTNVYIPSYKRGLLKE